MPTQDALDFIRALRSDPELREQLRRQAGDADLAAVIALGAETGHRFTREELEEAFRRDWAMRWLVRTRRAPASEA